jgi:hypothetical protein
MFVQGDKVVFTAPPIIRLDRFGEYCVPIWTPDWKSKAIRPLKLKYSMKLDLSHARMVNPKIKDLTDISSYLRAYTKPVRSIQRFISDYEVFVKEQKARYGDEIFVENYCQTFCEDDGCKRCPWRARKKFNGSKAYSVRSPESESA